jgi:uncharacterized protein (TIGR03435 family)
MTRLIALLLILGGTLTAQTPVKPRFEAVSIRPIESAQSGFTILTVGGLNAPDAHFLAIVGLAFEIRQSQIVGAPAWLGTDRYAILGRAEGKPEWEQIQLMIRTMLEERLGLVAHLEKREVQGYRLVVARPGQLGPSLRPGADCAPRAERPGGPCRIEYNGPSVVGRGQATASLARTLESRAGGIVIDQTGLAGIFDYELKYTPEFERNAATQTPPSTDAPNIFTAVQEQLGLRLEPARVPSEVLVIDKVSRPTAN